MPEIPVIFLACANSYKEGQRLAYLVRERRRIAEILAGEVAKGHCEVFQEGNTSSDFFFDELRKREYKGRISIIHFAGHADGEVLRFESEAGNEEEVHVDTLANFLKTLKGLKLIFLNGCGTQGIVNKLLESGVPAVIATQSAIEDHKAAKVAEEFYQGIAGGYSIKEAFEQAQAIAGDRLTVSQVKSLRGLEWEQDAGTTAPSFPWGLYFLEGNAKQLDWRLESSSPSPSTSGNFLTGKWKWPILALAILGLGVLTIALIRYLGFDKSVDYDKPEIGGTGTDYGTGEKKSLLSERIDKLKEETQFFGPNPSKTYNVLLVPFLPLKDKERNFEGYVKSRIRELSEDSKSPINLQIREISNEFHTANEQLTAGDAKKLGAKYGADMVVWGSYLFDQEKTQSLDLNVRSVPPVNRYNEAEVQTEIDLRRNKKGFRALPYPNYIASDSTIKEVEDVIFWARSEEELRQTAPDKALVYLSKIRDEYLPVHFQYISCYDLLAEIQPAKSEAYLQMMMRKMERIEDYPTVKNPQQQARFWFYKGRLYQDYGQGKYRIREAARWDSAYSAYSRAIRLQPNYAQAFFQRGRLLQYKLRDYQRAVDDYNRSIELDSLYGYAYFDRASLYHHHLNTTVPEAAKLALKDYSRVIALVPTFSYAYEGRGYLYKDHFKDFGKAKTDFDKALDLNEKLAYSYLQRADINRRQRSYSNALRDYNLALKYNTGLAGTYTYKSSIYANELVKQPLSERELDPEDKISVYGRLAEIHSKSAKDSLLMLQNTEILLKRGETLPLEVKERLRVMRKLAN